MTSRLPARLRRLLLLPALAACAGGGAPAGTAGAPARPRGVVAVTVVDSTTEGPAAGAARPARRAAGASGALRVAIEAPSAPLPVGGTGWLEAVVTDSLGRRVPDAVVLWSSSDTTVLAVPRVGRALTAAAGRGEGRALVTAAVGRATAAVEVAVGRAAPAAGGGAAGGAVGGAVGAAVGSGRVIVEPARIEARVGEQVILRAVALGARGDTLRACPLRWSTAGAPAAPAGGAPPGGATAVYRVLAPGPVMVTASCDGARGTAVVVVR